MIGFHGEIISGDINNPADLKALEAYKFDYIFHEVAISDTTVRDQSIMIQTNVNAFKSILDLAKSDAIVVYASSALNIWRCAFSSACWRGKPPKCLWFYKLAMDDLARKFCEQNPKMNIVGLRYFNVYGPREYFKNKLPR